MRDVLARGAPTLLASSVEAVFCTPGLKGRDIVPELGSLAFNPQKPGACHDQKGLQSLNSSHP